ncbi:MAG TPA: lysylphosphatidylglycerol synthase transmembrane domain-containing protein [Candidatus Saccharimonadales bacterium]
MQEQPSWFRRHWKLVVNVITLLALASLVYATRAQLSATLKHLGDVNYWVVLLLLPIEFLNYHAQARLYQRLFGIVGNKLSYWYLFRASLELNFVNHVFPSGGVTGLSYFSLRLREGEKLTGAKATLVHIMKIGLMFLSFELMLLFGVVCLTAENQVNNLVLLTAGSLATLVLLGTLGFMYMLERKSRIHGFFTFLTRALNRVIQLVRPKHPETINITKARAAVDDLHDNYVQIRHSYKQLKTPFWYSLLCNVTEVAAVYVIFVAFGHWVNLGAIILAYAVANFAGLISILPGGVGIYEALMTTVLATAGVPAGVSLPIIIFYRLANTLVQVPAGYYLYLQTLRQTGKPAKA